MILDQPERDRIVRNLRTSLCVEASAGTGKTTLMVDRVINLVLQGVPIFRIVAITFTEKAAGELKQRVREELEKRRRALPGASEFLGRALRELDTAQISTIHGFAASILRERPVEARVDPNFTQLDELGQALLVDEVWERWLDSILTSGGEPLKAALVAGVTLEQMRQLFACLYQQREYAGGLPQPVRSLREAALQVQRLMNEAESLRPSCIRPDEDTGFRQWSEALDSYRSVNPERPLTLVKFLQGLQLKANLGRQGNWKPGCCEKQKQAVAALRQVREQMCASLLADLLRLLQEAVVAVEAEKNRRNVLDFDDLLLKARDLLQEDKETRRYFQEQFQFILVDEFQDTDPLQVEIVFLLCAEDASAGRWDQVRLKPGKLCIVGDPKQSIYRFRRADIETYMEAQEILAAQGAVVPVRQNFRAVKPLVDWVNQVFRRLICREEKYQPAYQFLLTVHRPQRPESAHITLLYPSLEVPGMDRCRRMEADALVALLRRIRDQRWPVRTREGEERDPRWGDIAVLFNTLTHSYIYESRLRAAEIPYRLEGGKQFFTRQEIHALVACLKAIDDPTDQIALVAALRSLFFGFSDEELLALRRAWGPFSYFKKARLVATGGIAAAVPEVDPEVGAALALLRNLHEQRNQVSFACTLERLYRETGALEKHRLVWNGSQAAANLQKAALRARAFEGAGPTTFRRFVRWLGQLEGQERQEPESVLVEADEDAVELMSIHKSKGLEFPIVILANLSSGRSDTLAVVADRQSRSLEFRLGGDGGMKTAGFQAIKEKEDQRMEAEQKRLLYVGATRARDHLVVSTFHSEKGARGLLKHLLPLLPAASAIPKGEEETQIEFSLEETAQSSKGRGSSSPPAAGSGASSGLEPVAVRLWKIPPPDLPADPELSSRIKVIPEGEESWQRQVEQWRSERTAVFERAARSWSPASASGAKAESAAETSFAAPRAVRLYEASRLGSAFHRLMYRVPGSVLTSAGRVAGQQSGAPHGTLVVTSCLPADRVLVEQTALEYGLSDTAALADLLERPLPGVLAEALARARRIHREVPFLVNLPEEFARLEKRFPLLYEGFIDLILEQPDGSLLIVDYKTDRIDAGEVPSRMKQYQQQSRVYRAAAERATARAVGDVYFYFVRAGVIFSEQRGLLR